MASFDESTDIIDQTEVPFFKTALKYGLYGGGGLIIWTLLSGILGLNQISMANSMIALLVSILIYVGAAYAAIKYHRDEELGGFVTFGRAFLTGLVACIVTGIIGGLIGYLYYNMIDPNALEVMVESSAEMFEGLGMSEEQIEEAVKNTREGLGFGKLMQHSTIGAAIIGAIVSAIIGGIMKKEAPLV